MKKILLVGGGAREAAFAWKLQHEAEIYCASPHRNPTLAAISSRTGGRLAEIPPTEATQIAIFASEHNIDLAFVSADTPLESGVVDELIRKKITTVGPRRDVARIEWDKAFARELLNNIYPDLCPKYWLASNRSETSRIFREAADQQIAVVVKPQGLTGGKGVKVMGPHLSSYSEAEIYANEVLDMRIGNSDKVVIEERLEGQEFTYQALTDGIAVVRSPLTYDFPYRFDGDTGPGTGGMGVVTMADGSFPFLPQSVRDDCCVITKNILQHLSDLGLHFSGVLNVGFFWSTHGLKIMEFNARFGDPEAINIMLLLESSFIELLLSIAEKRLDPSSVRFKAQASAVRYLVPPEYAISGPVAREFSLPATDDGHSKDVITLFASSIQKSPDTFESIGTSRCLALGVTAPTLNGAGHAIDEWICQHFRGNLEYRMDIGTEDYFYNIASA